MHMTQSKDPAANRSERDLEALASVSRGLRTSADLDRQLGLILRLAAEAVGANRASVMLLNRETCRLEIRCSVGLPPEAILSTIGLGEGIAGWVAEYNQPFILHGPVTDPRFEGVDPTIDSSLCLPLAAQGNEDRVLGVLNLTRQPGDPFTVEDLRLASSLADLASVAVEKALLYASLRERESRVARLLEAAMNAQETERRRVAEELQDSFLEGLSGLFLQAEIARATLGRTAPQEAVAAVEQIQDAIQRTSARLRDSTVRACPKSVDERGLAAALADMVEEVGATSSLEAHFENRSGEQRLPGGVETILFRVAQEALRNVVTHGGTRRLWVALESNRDEARLCVRTDGRGVQPGPSAEHPASTRGLDTMREHLALAGGSVDVVAEPEGGTRISARIPLAAFRRRLTADDPPDLERRSVPPSLGPQ
jgi:two-component system, NarL family, sensor kinase